MPFLLATPVAEAAVATTARVAIPKLVKYLAKNGGDKLIKKYGQNAFEAVLGTTAGVAAYNKTAEKVSGYVDSIGKDTESTSSIPKGSMEGVDRMKQMDAVMAVPNVNRSVRETGQGLVIGGEAKEILPPPEPFSTPIDSQTATILSTPIPEKVDTTLSTPIPEKIDTKESFPDQSGELSKPIIYNKDDVSKQTKDLVPEKAELGPLSAVEKQTAIALKGNKPDFYSRAVEAITNAKQDKFTKGKWKSIIQSNSTKTEMDYLGLNEILQGNESITKQELLDIVSKKDITPDLVLTKIPKEDQLDFSTFSLGGAGDTTGQYVIQATKDFDAESLSSSGVDISKETDFGLSKKMYQATESHLKEAYGRNTIAHARTQIGYNPNNLEYGEDSPLTYSVSDAIKQASQELKNTFIIDEIQSDWIQDIQKFGTKEDFIIKKGSDIDSEFINKRYGNKYQLKTSKFSTMKQTLEETGLQYNKVLYVTDRTTGIGAVLTNIDSDKYYTFSKTRISGTAGFETEKDAKKNIEDKGISNLPIIESKKYVELMLNSLIKEAVLNGTDSIGITNGQIQGDRYEGQGDDESEGLKKFYDNIVIPQLEKIAEQYGVKDQIEKVTISEPEVSQEEDVKSIPNRMKMSMQNGFVLKKIRADLLYETLNDRTVTIPDYFTIYSNSGRAQGSDRIMDVIENDDSVANRIKNPKDYFIWVKEGSMLSVELDRQEDLSSLSKYMYKSFVDFSMPITIANPGNNLTTPEDNASKGTTNMTNYSSYILDYKNKGIDLGYEQDEHQIIKMPLPKRLQKDSLSKPIKLSKLETQTNKMLT